MARAVEATGTRGGRATASPGGAAVFDTASSEDNISRLLDAADLVPDRFKGSEKYFDLVSWNIAWFDHRDPDRVKAIAHVMAQINADLFVLLEIAEDGALEDVASLLADAKAGLYSTHYGSTGGQQRVALMWNRDWVRAKEEVEELFTHANPLLPAEFGGGLQRTFPRLPLWGYFEVRSDTPGEEGFTFELAGVHLKSQGPGPKGYQGKARRWGVPQRTQAANIVARWLSSPKAHFDSDVIVAGDWNAVPSQPEFAALRRLEARKRVFFGKVNDESEVSHLVRLNAKGGAGSRIDLHLVTRRAEAREVPDNAGVVIKWSLFDHLSTIGAEGRRELFAQLKRRFSDHLPVVSRFYLTES